MGTSDKKYDCQRGCEVWRNNEGELICSYNPKCCERSVFNWLRGIPEEDLKMLFEVRFKNTRKSVYKNDSGQTLREGDIVVTETQNGYDVGIITLSGPVIANQLKRMKIEPSSFEFKKIYRRAKETDIEKWQEAIAREHNTMIRSRQMAADLGLNMKIGDVEFQGDGSKAIFYYIADERVDFRQLIKNFAEEFHIRVEMKQIGARQEAGLIGGIGVCGQPLCCSRYMSDFQSITTAAARCQDLSLNPQKLAGQCGKLKCCINYEAAIYVDAREQLPRVNEPLHLDDGDAFLVKTDILKGIMWFSYDEHSMAQIYPLKVREVKDIIEINRRGEKGESLMEEEEEKAPEFKSAAGEDSITRFDEVHKKKHSHDKNKWHNQDKQQPQQPSQPQNQRQPQQPRQQRQPQQHQQQARSAQQSANSQQHQKPQQQPRPTENKQ
ncbi:MAG TPA: regulatory iron-sulfur-containing complex subunit RicT [Candidatus Egerieousia sp.]|nr:regulatory iron-sulfur-containing complex subunit RicT [Candidatus Egerieousia sp.]HPT05278.1 regulatory iron-sulfur-containing complex subunit RicT [Candidatus Egerieousia sp.]